MGCITAPYCVNFTPVNISPGGPHTTRNVYSRDYGAPSLGALWITVTEMEPIPAGTHRGFVADSTLHHVLVDLSLHRDQTLTHPAVDHWGAAALWGGERRVGRRILPEEHGGLSGAGERREACTEVGEEGQIIKQQQQQQQPSSQMRDCLRRKHESQDSTQFP